MARRRSSRRRSGGGGAGLLLIGALVAALALAGKGLLTLAQWYARTWRQSGQNGRIALAGGLAVILICACGLTSGPRSSSQPSYAAAARSAQATAAPVATRVPPAIASSPSPTPTARPPRPTAAPSATPAAPAGSVITAGNLRSEPRLSRETVIGTICAGDTVAFRSQQRVGDGWWYLVRVVARGASCGATAAAVGAEGWASAKLLTEPSSDVAAYARAAGISLPTAIVPPTATARPTAAPQRLTGGARVGAICRDGTRSSATGRGACSHHGGVDHWIVR